MPVRGRVFELVLYVRQQTHKFTFASLVFSLPENPGQRADVRVAVAGSDVAAGARTHPVHIVHRRLHLGQERGGIALGSGPRLRLRGPGVRLVRGAAEGEAGKAAEPLQTCGGKCGNGQFDLQENGHKRLTTAN